MSSSVRRKLLFTSLYFSEGAPIGFLWWALPTRLASAGVETVHITALTALLVLPWTFKFLWAPVIDALQFPRWNLRHWITLFQILMAVLLLPLMFFDLEQHFGILQICLLAHAFFAASQDVAIDAFCISVTKPEERGEYNGWMQTGMLVGRSILGGGALILFSRLGNEAVIGLLIASILSSGFLLWSLPEGRPLPVDSSHVSVKSARREFLLSIQLAFQERKTWFAILFALTAAAAFEGLGAIQGPVLRKQQMSEEQIGWLMAIPYVIALASGSVIGGYLTDRLGVRKLVGGSLLGFVTCVFLASHLLTDHLQLLSIVIVVNGFFVGMFTASTYAMFMNLTHPSVAGTQFSTLMGATNGCEAWSAWAIGAMSLGIGLDVRLRVLGVISLVSLLILLSLSHRERGQTA